MGTRFVAAYSRVVKTALLAAFGMGICAVFTQVHAAAPYRVAESYEDTVRIVIIWNNKTSDNCGNNVGANTRDFVIQSLDEQQVPNIETIGSGSATWGGIDNLWGTRSPHVIVHTNAGWQSANGPYINTIFDSAVANNIGVVSVGDDAAFLAEETFGFTNVDKIPQPMGDATQINDLWIGLNRAQDDSLKLYVDNNMSSGELDYPYNNGVISNAYDSVLTDGKLDFYPFGAGRCQADADKYNVLYPEKTLYLGYQRGYDPSSDTIGGKNELNVIVAIQDTVDRIGPNDYKVRRGVALSYQPQFIEDETASQQVTYDAIMWASLTHMIQPVNEISIDIGADTLIAGDTIKNARARLYYGNNVVIDPDSVTPEGDTLYNFVNWSILDPATGDEIVSDNRGASISMTSVSAYRTISLVSTYSKGSDNFSDTAQVYIKPGRPAQILLTEQTSVPLYWNEAQNIKTERVTLTSDVPQSDIHAFLYDRYGNRAWDDSGKATDALWDSRDANVASVNENDADWRNTIEKQGSGDSTWVVASFSRAFSDSDSVRVIAAGYTYTDLRFVWCNTGSEAPDSFTISTDGDTCLRVQGRRSDGQGWDDLAATWGVNPADIFLRVPNNELSQWTFEPVDTGTSRVIVNYGTATPDTIYITSIPAEPSMVSMRIINFPADGNYFIAGDEIRVEVTIQNSDSLAPSQWCYGNGGDAPAAWYQDDLGTGGLDSTPVLWSDEDASGINERPGAGQTLSQCFTAGRDTVRARIFHVAYDHRLYVNLPTADGNDTLVAMSEQFEIRHAPPDSIVVLIFDPSTDSFVEVADSVLLHTDSTYYFKATGWDVYGNPIDNFTGVWTPENISGTTDTNYVYPYTPTETVFKCGHIIVADTLDPSVTDSVSVCIQPPLIGYDGDPLTRDRNGNGYLDAVELTFTRDVTLTRAYLDSIRIEARGMTFEDSLRICRTGTDECISYDSGPDDSLRGTDFTVRFGEITTKEPQTSWEMYFTLQHHAVVGARQEVKDGAPPVIWKVYNYVGDQSTHTDDEIHVIFTEPLRDAIPTQDKPADYFIVTYGEDGDTVDEMLTSENNTMFFRGMKNDSTVFFRMVNDSSLTSEYYFRVIDGKIRDDNDNSTTIPNHPVQVTIKGADFEVYPAPNPFSPKNHEVKDTLSFNGKDNQALTGDGIEKQLNKNEFIHIVTEVLIPSVEDPADLKLTAELYVYDLIGNLVFHAKSNPTGADKIWETLTPGGTQKTFVDWDGFNERGMKVSPGPYRGIYTITLEYPDDEGNQLSEKQRDIVRIGITR